MPRTTTAATAKDREKTVKITPEASLIDVAFTVGTTLDNAGIIAVLTGGAAAMFYAGDTSPSDDADFVLRFGTDQEAETIMQHLGFRREGRIYTSDETRFTIEFPSGPLSIGPEIITTWNTVERDTARLHVISPYDATRDRLCSYFYWNDFSGLAAAVAIATAHPIDLETIRAWAKRDFEIDRSGDQVNKAERFIESVKRQPTMDAQ